LGVAVTGLVSDGTHDVGLPAIDINGVTHGFAINRETLIDQAILGIPAIQDIGDASLYYSTSCFTGLPSGRYSNTRPICFLISL
jgi:hypothetical protein